MDIMTCMFSRHSQLNTSQKETHHISVDDTVIGPLAVSSGQGSVPILYSSFPSSFWPNQSTSHICFSWVPWMLTTSFWSSVCPDCLSYFLELPFWNTDTMLPWVASGPCLHLTMQITWNSSAKLSSISFLPSSQSYSLPVTSLCQLPLVYRRQPSYTIPLNIHWHEHQLSKAPNNAQIQPFHPSSTKFSSTLPTTQTFLTPG